MSGRRGRCIASGAVSLAHVGRGAWDTKTVVLCVRPQRQLPADPGCSTGCILNSVSLTHEDQVGREEGTEHLLCITMGFPTFHLNNNSIY